MKKAKRIKLDISKPDIGKSTLGDYIDWLVAMHPISQNAAEDKLADKAEEIVLKCNEEYCPGPLWEAIGAFALVMCHQDYDPVGGTLKDRFTPTVEGFQGMTPEDGWDRIQTASEAAGGAAEPWLGNN